ncbi:hypothetical protein [Rhodovulum adriaticum]|uniref:Uncharacterized protein n=1 Tax=Rhodovulum adriaticum TaxID=35804 RepID=A0A4R2NLC5_RHOAD|nr:hypothetical protein [Rhodovulum adriaticum]MBK1637044.1 hypothetical protein [Rhodovulum adriaticum]TCP21984.1 hypothetical protein EV656_10830 [Rhodovulum adriaticum]
MFFWFTDLAAADAVARRFGGGMHPDLRAALARSAGRDRPETPPTAPEPFAADPKIVAFPGPPAPLAQERSA